MSQRAVRPSRPVPERLDLAPVLPMLYVAWSDGVLGPDEIDQIRERAGACPAIGDDAVSELDAWLDPGSPPSPTELRELRALIRRRAANAPRGESAFDSLAELGLALADNEASERWLTPPAADSLREVEKLLGVQGAEAARELLGASASAPPGAPEATPSGGRAEPAPSVAATAAEIRAHIQPGHAELRRELLDLLCQERFRVPFGTPKSAYRERVLSLLQELADRGYGALAFPVDAGGAGDVAGSIAVFETLAMGDLSLLVKFGVQFGLFGGSILNLGTERHHRRYLSDVGSLRLPGCYAMSETGHGSNVHDIETVARHDSETGEFVVDTPTPSASKDWIGNAARHGRLATVFAQLEVDGERHGVHALLVPIRDEHGTVLPGVEIEDCGHKVGLNGVDNGRIRFAGVRVPAEALLDRFAWVTEEGVYESPIPSEGRRFFTMLGTLVAGRVSIAAASVSASKRGLATAIRYSAGRQQFGPSPETEVPILEYLAHQRLLLPRLAKTYALDFAVQDLVQRYSARSDATQRELEVRAAALKSVASWHNIETLQACREASGGQGYLSDNLFGRLKDDTDVFTTFEGANPVLMQLVSKGLLTRYKQEMGDLKLWGIARYIAESAGRRVAELNPVITRRHDDEHLLDPEFHRSAVEYREDRLLGTLARRLKARMDDGMDSFDAMNECQDHMITLAEAHADRLLVEAFQAGLDTASHSVREALLPLYRLFALHTFETRRAWFLESGYMDPAKTKAIRTMVSRLCRDVQPAAVHLVDAFMIPDILLGRAVRG